MGMGMELALYYLTLDICEFPGRQTCGLSQGFALSGTIIIPVEI